MWVKIVQTQTKTGGESEVNEMVNAVEENCGFKKGKLCLEKFWPIRAWGGGGLKLIGPMPIKNSKIFLVVCKNSAQRKLKKSEN